MNNIVNGASNKSHQRLRGLKTSRAGLGWVFAHSGQSLKNKKKTTPCNAIKMAEAGIYNLITAEWKLPSGTGARAGTPTVGAPGAPPGLQGHTE